MRAGGAPSGRGSVWIAVVVLACIHFLFRPALNSLWSAPDLLAASLLVGTLYLAAGRAAALGFVLGALEGWMALSGTAPLAVGFTVAGYVGVRAWDLFFADVRFFLPVYLLLGAWALTVMSAWTTSVSTDAEFLFLRAGSSAVLTMLVCVGVERIVPSAHR